MKLRTRSRKRRLAIEALEERCCPTTALVSGLNPITIPIPGVHRGDYVAVEAVMTSMDPFEVPGGSL
jgi:hypothetical protein